RWCAPPGRPMSGACSSSTRDCGARAATSIWASASRGSTVTGPMSPVSWPRCETRASTGSSPSRGAPWPSCSRLASTSSERRGGRPSWRARLRRLGRTGEVGQEMGVVSPRDPAPRLAMLLATAVCASACTTRGQGGPPSALMKASGTEATATELRAATNSLSLRVPGLIEQSGNQMLAATVDPTLRKRALRWKIDGTAAFHQTLFRPDPLAALFETWALAVQLDDWVDSAEVRKGLGAVHPFAESAAQTIRGEAEGTATRGARRWEGAAKMKELVEAWAHEHPIQGLFPPRPTAEPLLAKLASDQDVGLVEAVGQATSTLDDLST